MSRTLPERANIEFLSKQAKVLLQNVKAGVADARERLRAWGPPGALESPKLADCQHALAREYGFASWARLRTHVQTVSATDPMEALAAAPKTRNPSTVAQVLAAFPSVRARLDEPVRDGAFGATPLIVAVQQANRELVDVLLENGASINQRSHWWAGGFHVLEDDHGLADFLLARGAVLDSKSAAQLGRLDDLAALVAANPQSVHLGAGDGQTPLHVAPTVAIAEFLLVCCPSDSFTNSLDLREDRVSRRGPHKGVAVPVVMVHEVLDLGHQVPDAAEGAATDGALGDKVEPDLHLVQPRGIGRRVVHVEARVSPQPASHRGVLVRGIVVDDQMDVQVRRHCDLDVAQEVEELLMPMAPLTLAEHLTRGDVERREQRCGSVADVVVGDSLDVAQAQRQEGLRALEGLDLALLIDTEDHGVIGRMQIQPDDVPHLLDEEGIRRELEMLLPMGLEPEGLPDPMHRGLRQPGFGAEGPAGPVRLPIPGVGLDRPPQKGGDLLIADRARPARPQLIVQALHALAQVALAPLSDGGLREAEVLGDDRVAGTVRSQQDNPRPSHQRLGHRPRPRQGHELVSLRRRHRERLQGAPACHGFLRCARREPMAYWLFNQAIPGTAH
jgi:hypothetical protein